MTRGRSSWRATERRSSSSTASPTAPTPGGSRSTGLARAERRAVALDLPGFGTADPLTDEPVLPQLDAFAEAALEQFAPDGGAIVAGNSLGGCVAMRLAERAELAGIVPVAPAGLDMARWFVLLERDPLIRRCSPRRCPCRGRWCAASWARPTAGSPSAIRGASTRRSRRRSPATSATGRPCGRIYATAQRLLPELRDPFRLEQIDCPVLLVWGRQDLLVFQTGADRVIDTVEDARLEVIEDCGHCPQVECPERFCELLLDFPARLARAA